MADGGLCGFDPDRVGVIRVVRFTDQCHGENACPGTEGIASGRDCLKSLLVVLHADDINLRAYVDGRKLEPGGRTGFGWFPVHRSRPRWLPNTALVSPYLAL